MGNFNTKIRNCTDFQVRYWRMTGIRYNFLKPGKEGTYTWGATYTLCVDRLHNPKCKYTRYAVNPGGIYYVIYGGGKLHICDEEQIKNVQGDENNPHIEVWLSDQALIEDLPERKIQWCCIFQDTNQNQSSERNVVVEWNKGGSLNEAGSTRHVQKVLWPRGHMSQEQVYSQKKREETFTLKPGESIAAWQACVEVTIKAQKVKIFLPIYHTKCNRTASLDNPPENSENCTVSIMENTCRTYKETP